MVEWVILASGEPGFLTGRSAGADAYEFSSVEGERKEWISRGQIAEHYDEPEFWSVYHGKITSYEQAMKQQQQRRTQEELAKKEAEQQRRIQEELAKKESELTPEQLQTGQSIALPKTKPSPTGVFGQPYGAYTPYVEQRVKQGLPVPSLMTSTTEAIETKKQELKQFIELSRIAQISPSPAVPAVIATTRAEITKLQARQIIENANYIERLGFGVNVLMRGRGTQYLGSRIFEIFGGKPSISSTDVLTEEISDIIVNPNEYATLGRVFSEFIASPIGQLETSFTIGYGFGAGFALAKGFFPKVVPALSLIEKGIGYGLGGQYAIEKTGQISGAISSGSPELALGESLIVGGTIASGILGYRAGELPARQYLYKRDVITGLKKLPNGGKEEIAAFKELYSTVKPFFKAESPYRNLIEFEEVGAVKQNIPKAGKDISKYMQERLAFGSTSLKSQLSPKISKLVEVKDIDYGYEPTIKPSIVSRVITGLTGTTQKKLYTPSSTLSAKIEMKGLTDIISKYGKPGTTPKDIFQGHPLKEIKNYPHSQKTIMIGKQEATGIGEELSRRVFGAGTVRIHHKTGLPSLYRAEKDILRIELGLKTLSPKAYAKAKPIFERYKTLISKQYKEHPMLKTAKSEEFIELEITGKPKTTSYIPKTTPSSLISGYSTSYQPRNVIRTSSYIPPKIKPSISSMPSGISKSPSIMPSISPMSRYVKQSKIPSIVPSTTPSITPSKIPSIVPSTTPSITPYITPTKIPYQPPKRFGRFRFETQQFKPREKPKIIMKQSYKFRPSLAGIALNIRAPRGGGKRVLSGIEIRGITSAPRRMKTMRSILR